MSEPKTKTDIGFVAECLHGDGLLLETASDSIRKTSEKAAEHVIATKHRVFIHRGNIMELGDPDKDC